MVCMAIDDRLCTKDLHLLVPAIGRVCPFANLLGRAELFDLLPQYGGPHQKSWTTLIEALALNSEEYPMFVAPRKSW